jgi:hypothetical protein
VVHAPSSVEGAVARRLDRSRATGERVDYLTFVPSGEPTLDANLGRTIGRLKRFGLGIAVVTNASLLWRSDVRDDLAEADWVSVKVDTVREATRTRLNRPHRGLSIERQLAGAQEFARQYHGTLTTETMLVAGLNDSDEEVAGAAQHISTLGYEVLVLDADSTNVGLGRALGIGREPEPLLDYFEEMVFSGGSVTCPVDDPLPLPGASIDLDELPRPFIECSADGVWLLVAGKLGALGPGAGCDGPIIKIARDLRVRGLGPEGITLVDYKAGFEDSARGALTSLDWALTVVDPTVASVHLSVDLARMVRDMRGGIPPATRHLEDATLVDVCSPTLPRVGRARDPLGAESRGLDGDGRTPARRARPRRSARDRGVRGRHLDPGAVAARPAAPFRPPARMCGSDRPGTRGGTTRAGSGRRQDVTTRTEAPGDLEKKEPCRE